MEKFDKAGTCPQCGEKADFHYHHDGTYFKECLTTPGLDRKPGPSGGHTAIPHMHRKCTVCKYEWAEAPLV
jgi:rubredoxin